MCCVLCFFFATHMRKNMVFRLVYLEKLETSKLYVFDVSMVSAYSILLFGGNIDIDNKNGHLIVDKWIRFIAPPRIAVIIKELRKCLDFILLSKITYFNQNNNNNDNQNNTDNSNDNEINNHYPIINAIEQLLITDGR